MKKVRVYVTAKGSHDYSKAEEHGELIFLYDEDRKANVFASDALVKEIEERLSGSTPDDFLLLSGSMTPAAIAFSVMMQKHGLVNNLLFSFKCFLT